MMISKLAIYLSFFMPSITFAQVWGTQGSWEMVLPVPDSTGNTNSPNQAFWNAGFVAGNLLITANSTTSQLV